MINLIEVKNLSKTYSSGVIYRTFTHAVKNVSFAIKEGQLVSLVGESGSGKSTIAKVLLKLEKRTEGSIKLNGKDIDEYNSRDYYRQVQVIFQDPYSSINFFYRIDRVLKQALSLTGKKYSVEEEQHLIQEVLQKVGIDADEILGRFPHQLSGGQLQRFLIARVLLIRPQVVIADEITSMIDASSRAGILNLLNDLRDKEGLTVLFITHDIGQAQYLSDEIFVLKDGNIVEQGDVNQVLTKPQHEYTQHLLASVPSLYTKWDLDS